MVWNTMIARKARRNSLNSSFHSLTPCHKETPPSPPTQTQTNSLSLSFLVCTSLQNEKKGKLREKKKKKKSIVSHPTHAHTYRSFLTLSALAHHHHFHHTTFSHRFPLQRSRHTRM
uniref:Uncharacterized protein n=1 Tax=Trypanosoma vivax (strain Y486) TaxID=1055687 RepID=G0UBP8_TRYVY|nr:hypothetical protein TVY486_1107300 [Trypanosoma vivax Y486]